MHEVAGAAVVACSCSSRRARRCEGAKGLDGGRALGGASVGGGGGRGLGGGVGTRVRRRRAVGRSGNLHVDMAGAAEGRRGRRWAWCMAASIVVEEILFRLLTLRMRMLQ